MRLSGLLLAVAVLGRPVGASAAGADTPATPATGALPPAAAASELEVDRRLGPLERESVAEALASLGLTVEPHPERKRIRQIHAVSQDVFSKHDWLFQLFNIFHRTTRPLHLQRELLVAPGQLYDQALVDESVRNLQLPPVVTIAASSDRTLSPPELSSVVAIVPVVSPEPGTVDILAVTRDLWSLRFNTNFEFQGSALSLLQSSLSENNLLGWRKYLALTFQMDLGRYGFGPSYIDPNIMGTRLLLVARATLWYARDTDRYEGDTEIVSLRYPLYSLASRWGAGVDVTHQDAVVRNFLATSVRQVGVNTAAPQMAPMPGDIVEVPYKYRRRILTTDVNVLRSFPHEDVIQRLVFGHRFDRRRSLVTEDFPVDPYHPDLARQFLDQQAPIDETRSEPYLRYEVFTARYATFRDLDTFDLRENHRLGPQLEVEVGAGLPALGADVVAFPIAALVGWSIGSANGAYGYVQIQGSARARGGGWIDETLDTKFLIASPPIASLARLILYARTESVRDDTHRTKFFIGGATGLRGYAIGDFDGSSAFVAHVELRSLPLAIFSQRFGALLFYDAGDANRSFAELVPHHDVGVGARWLIPQLNSAVLRIDWAVATQSGPETRPGLPGRVTAGYMQVY